MAADLTQKLPVETLNEIIAWVDDRRDLHATAHICQRWWHVAFDHPRRFCWFRCAHQIIPSNRPGTLRDDPATLQLAFARLKCRLAHPRVMDLFLDELEVETARAVLQNLPGSIPQTSDLYIGWDIEALTQNVFDALASHPAPLLTNLSLRHRALPAGSDAAIPRVPGNIFAGTSPVLRKILICDMDLPEAPLPQFSSVITVRVDTEAQQDGMSWDFQDRFVQHFPAMTSIDFLQRGFVRLATPSTPKGALLMGRLTMLKMNERMLDAALDDYPELAGVAHIKVHSQAGAPPALARRILEKLLGHFGDEDFAVDARHPVPLALCPAVVVLSRIAGPERTRKMDVPLDDLNAVFARAPRELHLVRAVLASGAFTALWPVLLPDSLLTVRIFIKLDACLPLIPSGTPQRVLPLLREFVITRRQYTTEHTALRAGELSKFVPAVLRVSGVRTITLRLEGISVDRVTPAVQRMFTDVVQERISTAASCVIM